MEDLFYWILCFRNYVAMKEKIIIFNTEQRCNSDDLKIVVTNRFMQDAYRKSKTHSFTLINTFEYFSFEFSSR